MCWQLAGIAGVGNPLNLSLRQLWQAADARETAEWDRTSAVMAWVGRLGKGLNDPTVLNPRRARRAMRRIRHPASREVQNRLAWGYLGQFLGQQTKR